MLYCTIEHIIYNVLCVILLHYITLHYITLHYITLHHIVLDNILSISIPYKLSEIGLMFSDFH